MDTIPKFEGQKFAWELDPEVHSLRIGPLVVPWEETDWYFNPESGTVGRVRTVFRPSGSDPASATLVKESAFHDEHVYRQGDRHVHGATHSPIFSWEKLTGIVEWCRDNEKPLSEGVAHAFADDRKLVPEFTEALENAPEVYPKNVADELNRRLGLDGTMDAKLARARRLNEQLKQASELAKLEKENEELREARSPQRAKRRRENPRPTVTT